MISIRKLAAVDMAWLGVRVILAEYVLGVFLPLALGLLTIRASLLGTAVIGWEAALGIWLVTIGLNYIPLLIYAIIIARAGTAKKEGGPEIARARQYGTQQIIILVPLLVVIVAVMQEVGRQKA